MSKFKKLLLGILSAGLVLSSPFLAHAVVCLVQNGCLGTGTLPAPGQVPIGTSGSIYAPGYLTAGSNISIATSSGGISISSPSGSATSTITAQGTTASSPFTFATSGPMLGITTDGAGTVTFTMSSSSLNLGKFLTATTTISAQGVLTTNSALTFATSGPMLSITTNGAGVVTFTMSSSSLNLVTPPGTSTLTAQGATATGPGITLATSGPMLSILCGVSTCTFTMSSSSLNLGSFITTSSISIGGVNSSTFLLGSNLFINSVTGQIGVTSTPIFTGLSLFGAAVNVSGTLSFTNATGSTPTSSISLFGATFQNLTSTRATLTSISSTNMTVSGGSVFAQAQDAQGNKYSTSTGAGTPAGVSTDVQINNGGAFGADAGGFFQYSTSTTRLWLSATTSSIFIGSNADFVTSTIPGAASSTSFSSTGATSSWAIPTGVTSITVTVVGGKAGGANNFGGGGSATGTLAVVGGTTYWFNVGGNGVAQTGGYGGGGDAAGATGGGGGKTWFGTASTGVQGSLLLVGGGGGGRGDDATNGGNGGGATGQNGGTASDCVASTGGSQSAGGSGGTVSGGTSGAAGAFGVGGNGASNGGAFGGAGGGGYFGGGGGAAKGGDCADSGAGGSGFASSTLSSTSTAQGTNATSGIYFSYNLPSTSSLFSSSTAALYVGGHIFTGNQNLATSSVSSCGTGAGVQGNDTAGIISVGTGVITSCTLTFGKQFSNPPSCTANDATSILAVRPLTTSSTLVLSSVSTFAGDNLAYHCLDY